MKKIYFLALLLFSVINVNAQVINFSDLNFKNYLLSATTSNGIAQDVNNNPIIIDANSNNEIEEAEATAIYTLSILSSSITNLEGLSYFINLRSLEVSQNSTIVSLDTTDLIHLKNLICYGNSTLNSINLEGLADLESIIIDDNTELSTINTNGLTSLIYLELLRNPMLTQSTFNHLIGLEELYCNTLTTLNIDGLQNLRIVWLICQEEGLNLFTSVSLSNLPNLVDFQVDRTGLSNLSLVNLPKLRVLWVSNNQLSEIDLSGLNMSSDFVEEKFFFGRNNFFSALDFSGTNFTTKDIINNQLVYLNLKDSFPQDADNNFGIGNLQVQGNPNLQFICVNDEDEIEFQNVQNAVNVYGYTNCVVNSYCSFVPGVDHFIVDGSAKLNFDNSDCDTNDLIFPLLKFSITNGTQNGTFLANQSGNYSIALLAGEHTITPILENQSYFSVSPPSLTLNFPELTSPVTQNFCIIPNGTHNDLEVTLLPLLPARPGFNATYKVVYKNKGNSTLSGSITFEFEDDKMDLVSSVPNSSAQVTGLLTYDYLNLQPFETREILLTLNINSPQETPAVTIGDQLNFSAVINPLADDETEEDNTSSLKQVVVGSYDPNDKTCIEGTVVGPEMIGQYVHYLIRFENTGTFPAENIVVKDMIDLTKFDLSTLIPTSSSHSFVTRIAADGKVEFIFENIQLPFDDANNDGYIAFKIKTLPSLAIGDTFSNNANIYFDYNFPIETNTATTAIQVLGNSDFNLTDYVTLYPNPVKNELNIKVNNTISITSINIYNSLGQLVLVSTNPSESIDVSELKTGSYLMKLITDKGISNSQFIKK
ncbi:MAG: T9SS type A sorting domain-containing protein [Flavobacteriales bacterium]|nr:T9SS type A sorting domain-containing protein [Flavobacteriales bacterium]